jgi:hypothetical protein
MKTHSSSEAVLTALRRLRLMEFDWDGAGGLPLRGDVGDTVTDIYELSFTSDMPMPAVSMNGDGTIDVEYDGEDGRKLFLTFKCQGVLTYIKVFEDDQTTVEGTIRLDAPGPVALDDFVELTELFEWLASE